MTASYAVLQERAQGRQWALAEKRRVRVGTALCGMAAGAGAVLDAVRREVGSLGLEATVSEVGCLGLCYAEPLVDFQSPGGQRVFYGNVAKEQAPRLVRAHLVEGQPAMEGALATLGGEALPGVPALGQLPMMKGQLRIALGNAGHIDPGSLEEYVAVGGYGALDKALSGMAPQQVLEEVARSGLRGRGGAAFPTGVKWRFLASSPGPVKYILANCEEGDPGAFNDKAVLESDPHALLEGIVLAGYATGASKGFVFVRHGHEGPIHRMREAVQQAYAAGLLGANILGAAFSFDCEVVLVGESYVSGEETALMEAIEGKRATPRYRPPFPAAVGLWGKPSNINNIKTLTYVPPIVARGGSWFASIGTERSKGTAILCLSGAVQRPGMVEVPMGRTLREAVEGLGGGVAGGRKLKLLQTGGPLGGLLSADKLDIPLDFDAMARAGAILGSGGIIVADDTACAVDLTRLLVAFCQFESCGKCFPCRLGTTHLLEIMERICRFQARPGDLELMHTVGTQMAAGSLCGHGQLGFNPVQSALKSFGAEFTAHIERRTCPAGVCDGKYLTPERSRR
ncbi:MAG: SLBB domain-containing protein [Chloroflexi bacterium]|nr:SLBB domain-containing protein [Chloroflexota bacterium]